MVALILMMDSFDGTIGNSNKIQENIIIADTHKHTPAGRYIPDSESVSSSFSPLYPDTAILISVQGESVISVNSNT